MHVIAPLVNAGPYVEQHEYWYNRSIETPVWGLLFCPVSTAEAHARFVRRYAQQIREESRRALRDAREQFSAKLAEVTA